ncbi:hypothetical protein AMAG_05935 [Allomyces macrogynus ATCC 38327]|uniref:Uncharacterized protein n=1 Tax=Allomyces macrogynus (strain ATCC 38327) TaxID=578462 RepID=A0A0L0SDP8_ALLM3|nr:hypothetical protein AMAG_05935 [Allomyces macrogynus ATCC 38327]|eukprot:KNE60557.1 hypothetical protein AMAG_05935 [Allomyces macrogynus ATCC 38327]
MLPVLYELQVTFQTDNPIRSMLVALRLQKLSIQAQKIHSDLVQTHAARSASMLRELDLNAGMPPNSSRSTTPETVTRDWLWLRVPRPLCPSLTTARLDALNLPSTIFADLAAVALRLAQLDLTRSLLIDHGVPRSRAVLPALDNLVVHDLEVIEAAATAVDAPVLKHVCLHGFVTKVPWPSVTSGELVALGWIGYRPVVRRTKVWPR